MYSTLNENFMLKIKVLNFFVLLTALMIMMGSLSWAKTNDGKYQASIMNLPLRFEANKGQFHSNVDFISRGQGYSVYLTSTQMVLDLGEQSLRMEIMGANRESEIKTTQPLPGKVNYIRGNDSKKWHTNIPTYKKVMYQKTYPGIDLAYYGRQGKLEYDFIVHPGGDPSGISLKIHGVDQAVINKNGELVLKKQNGEVRFNKPICYQDINGQRKIIAGKYVRQGNNQIGFSLEDYDPAQTLVIDPILDYCTYLGGWQTDTGADIAVDSAGNAYVVGSTKSDDFPVTDGSRPREPNQEVFVAKLNPDGTDLIYSTYIGGTDDDMGRGIALDTDGCVYIVGFTKSNDFPLEQPGQPTYGGGNFDAFVSKLSADGSTLIYSTYVGGSGEEFGEDIDIGRRSFDRAYFVGTTNSEDLPVHNAFMSEPGNCGGDAFTGRLSFTGGILTMDYLTYLGGNKDDKGHGIAVDFGENVYVTGKTISSDFPTTTFAFQPDQPLPDACNRDAFVTKFSFEDPHMTILYSTYLGGVGSDEGKAIAVDPFGGAVVTGFTTSPDFPIHEAFSDTIQMGGDAFVTKMNGSGSDVVFSTYLGGNNIDEGLGVTVSGSDLTISVTGQTYSEDFFILRAVQSTNPDPDVHPTAFVTHFTWFGDPIFSTYIGGISWDVGNGIAAGSPGDVYVVGATSSDRHIFPVTAGAFQEIHGGVGDGIGDYDAFVLKIGPDETKQYQPDQQQYEKPWVKEPPENEKIINPDPYQMEFKN